MEWKTHFYNKTTWNSEISNREKKIQIAHKLAQRIKGGDVVGVGSGSTCFLALQVISERCVKEKISALFIPTSKEMEMVCASLNLSVSNLLSHKPDWCFDGADEVDNNKRLIKGRGGALFREKLVMQASSGAAVILVDESKMVNHLGSKFAIPVEVYPEAVNLVKEKMEALLQPKNITLRLAVKKDGPVITENGNFILDVSMNGIAMGTEKIIKSIPGVIESGLFEGYNIEVLSS